MRITDSTDNGNLAFDNRNNSSQNNTNGHWTESTTENYKHNDNIDNTTRFVTNDIIDNKNFNTDNIHVLNSETKICNRQYNLNNNENLTSSLNITNLDQNRQTQTRYQDNALDNSSKAPVLAEEREFDHSDSDEMSENSVRNVPRGIVNPNYPGFQHLAHTLQDYSSNIEQFYQSDNDMTDDDLDVDITPETTFDINEKINNKFVNNNNNKNENSVSKNNFTSSSQKQSSNTQNDIPDLLKTVTLNNNNDSSQYEFSNCSTTDIENNFRAKDIIGDFNKEVEDEIRQLLNYNINIEDDLEELRRDIKDTFAKPIENTLNNISDVVNHVIKKLVENDDCDRSDASTPDIIIDHEMEDMSNMNRENETNTRTELSINRPTFLLFENNKDVIISDALLSDGKEEININVEDYDTEHLSHNVENTIKQLSTELRKIIPKLNEMRERDKLWVDNKKEGSVLTDGNSNTVVQGSSTTSCDTSSLSQSRNENNSGKTPKVSTINQRSIRAYIDPKLRQNSKKSVPKVQKNLSVRNNDNHDEGDLEGFDVYNIETALPKLDLDAIESHIKAAKDAERRKRNDREEIRKRLAMGGDTEEYYSLGHTDRPGKKPSLHSRLQNGKNLQICFMNETASDNESQASDLEHNISCNSKSSSRSSLFSKNSYNHPYQTRPLSVNITKNEKNNTPSGKWNTA